MYDVLTKIKDELTERRKIGQLYFTGIFTNKKILNIDEIHILIEFMAHYGSARTVVIDNYCDSPNIDFIKKHNVIWLTNILNDDIYNALRVRPDYVIYLDSISEDNIENLIKIINTGHHLITFFDKDEDTLLELIKDNVKLGSAGTSYISKFIF